MAGSGRCAGWISSWSGAGWFAISGRSVAHGTPGPGREVEVEPHRFDPSGARRVGGGSEVVVHMEQDHPLEHRPDELRERAFDESRDDMRVTDVEAHADVLAREPSNELVHGARAVADVLGARIHRRQVLDREPHVQLRGARQHAPQRALLVPQSVRQIGVATGTRAPWYTSSSAPAIAA